MAAQLTTHPCPGECGSNVPNRLFACRPCWQRLPRDLAQPILATYRIDDMAHLRAMADARRWYRANAR